ncbi:MAG: hypothetical protein A3A28_05700 [Candidatus Sungbacteria bacterium RIFCSPLOWO2_01_FULL_47_32]|nr:MAG: hypothetical protein A3A28_05700 [Candidatus Sungbacteria bacterium RIFCSPLOWO2_01_FULL_47_32]
MRHSFGRTLTAVLGVAILSFVAMLGTASAQTPSQETPQVPTPESVKKATPEQVAKLKQDVAEAVKGMQMDMEDIAKDVEKNMGPVVGTGAEFSAARYKDGYAFVVASVRKDSPAEKAGLKMGDYVVAFNGKAPLMNGKDALVTVRTAKAGSTLTLSVVREDKPMTVNVPAVVLRADKTVEGKALAASIRTEGKEKLDKMSTALDTLVKAVEAGEVGLDGLRYSAEFKAYAVVMSELDAWLSKKSEAVETLLK